MKVKLATSVFGLLLLLLACAHSPIAQKPVDQSKTRAVYQIGFGDILEVKFFDNNRFSRDVVVRPDGRITMEKIGDVHVSGLTPFAVDSIITAKYQGILKSPDVTVFVNQFGNQKVYLLGEVLKPGGYPVERDMTVVHAIALAGGFKPSANKNSVIMLRKNESGILAARRVDMKKLLSFNSDVSDPQIKAMDIIYVPRSFISNVDAFIDRFYDIILPPVDVYWKIWFMDKFNNDE